MEHDLWGRQSMLPIHSNSIDEAYSCSTAFYYGPVRSDL